MLKLLVTVVFLLACLYSAWYLANPDLWNQQPLMPQSDAAAATAGTTAAVDFVTVDDSLLAAASNSTAGFHAGQHLREELSSATCTLAATSDVTRAATPAIYRWTDAGGVTHFSDVQPATGNAERYDPGLPGRQQYFALDIDYRGSAIVPFFRAALTAQATGIYEIISGLVGARRLRQVSLNIVLFPDERAYQRYASAATGRNMASTGGYYSTVTNEAVTWIYPDRDTTQEVARHEATHVIARGILGLVPPWLNEGLADYFAGLGIRGQLTEVSPNAAQLQLASAALRGGYPRSLAEFMALSGEQWRNPELESTHYAVAWSLVYFMLGTDDGTAALATLMQTMADQYCQSFDSVAALAAAYPGGIGRLQQRFQAWLRQPGSKPAHIY